MLNGRSFHFIASFQVFKAMIHFTPELRDLKTESWNRSYVNIASSFSLVALTTHSHYTRLPLAAWTVSARRHPSRSVGWVATCFQACLR